MEENIRFADYERFGAAGDGKTDDLPAIVRCHEWANAHGVPVRTKDDAVYYIGGRDLTAHIRTDTDFGTSRFIIDDRKLENIRSDIYEVCPDHERVTLYPDPPEGEHPYIRTGTDVPCYVRIESDERMIYIRKGLNKSGGVPQGECLLTDGTGRVLSGIDWEYSKVTKAWAVRTDDVPVTVRGGVFTTIANTQPSFYNYHCRGISIRRSHTVAEKITHYVEGELDHGAPYSGFLRAVECTDVTIRGCLLTPHYIYETPSRIPGKMVSMGSYDFSADAVIGLRLQGLRQSIGIMDRRYWGLMGTNFCKDVTLEDCVISRFDAHMGVTGLQVRRCRLGWMRFNLIGHGNTVVEDTEISGPSFINLRQDYGSNYDGKLVIRNAVWHPENAASTLIAANNTGDHDFGYRCSMPHTLVIENLHIADEGIGSAEPLYLLPDYDPDFAPDKPFPYNPVSWVAVRGIRADSGREWELCEKPEEYPATMLVCR